MEFEIFMKVALVVPTYNAGKLWERFLHSYEMQSVKVDKFIVIDSSSSDSTRELALKYGAEVYEIEKSDFNHGGTRNYGASLCGDVNIIIFMTQDAIFENSFSIAEIIKPFHDESISAICGRQIAHEDATPIAIHAREYNYDNVSSVKSCECIKTLGIKAAFMSNSFSAYRKSAFDMMGGFPRNTILAEDMYMSAKMILAGQKVAYCADAIVRHSHNYTPWEEFRRYFDIGVFHACEPWIQDKLGAVSGEGFRFIKSELNYLLFHAPKWIPRACLNTACKFIGYKLGVNYRSIPKAWRRELSMYKSYWLQQDGL